MSTWTKIQKLRGIRKSLVQKEEIIDKKLVDELNFFTRQLLLMNIDRIGWQAKMNWKIICHKTRYLLSNSDMQGGRGFFYVHVDKG